MNTMLRVKDYLLTTGRTDLAEIVSATSTAHGMQKAELRAEIDRLRAELEAAKAVAENWETVARLLDAALSEKQAAPVPPAAVPDDVAKDAWQFSYSSGTRFVGAHHPKGGKQSVCAVTNHLFGDELGNRIAELLNNYGTGSAAILAANKESKT